MAKENVKEYGAFSQYMLLREATKDIKRDKKEENEESIVSITSLVPEMNSDGLNLDVSKIHRGKVPSAGSPWLVRPDRNSDSSIQIVLRFIDEKSNTSLTEFGNNRGYMLRWLSPLKDQLLVDLGAGVSADGYRFAMIAGARGYIGIEAFFADRLMARVKQEIFTAGTEGQRCIPASIISEDMLHALQRFPPHSVSVLASAIDNFLMWDDPAYLKKVGNEASRILHPKGTFITFASDITP
ncbi:MAG: hypothetical protein ABSD68_04215, partial [Candidatus Micrarchaeales archaeon]